MSARVRLLWTLLLAVVAGVGAYIYLSSLRHEVTVVLVTRDIPARSIITADMLRTARIRAADRSAVLPNSFATPEHVIGLLTVQEIPRGEPVRNDPRWVTREEGAIQAVNKQRLSYFLPKDTRAVTVQVDSQGMVAGRVREGDLVDVLFTSRDDSTGGVYSAIILQRTQVLAVDASGGQYQVTLLVTPEQGLDLTLAKRRGTIDLALSPRTAEPVSVPPASPLKFSRMGSRNEQAGSSTGSHPELDSPRTGLPR